MNNLMAETTATLSLKLSTELDKILLNALENNGIKECDIKFVIDELKKVYIEGDKFEHYYFRTRRIISIEKLPYVKYEDGKITVEKKYY